MSLTREEFVRALYRGLLDREPDADGFAHHVASFNADPAAMAEMVRGFVGSDEFRRGRSPADVLEILRPASRSAPFAHVASLGAHCYASATLKSMGLKRYSLPFDWIFSNLAMVTHCIEDDFVRFLDPGEYRANPPEARPELKFGLCEHSFYRRTCGVEQVFNHFDPNGVAEHAYLIRAVGRFRRLLASPARKLFLAVVRTQHPAALIPDFERLVQVLEEQSANLQVTVLAVLPNGGEGDFSHAMLRRIGPHSLSAMQPLAPMDGIKFPDPFDELFVRRLIARHPYALEPAI